jgi:uncharacterized protein YdaU (DUF1376 family)
MATPYFALYPTDFLADIGHLGNTELGIYWRLLLVYYRDGRPLPFDPDRLRRMAMSFSPEECRCLESVVAEFFSLDTEPDGTRVWRHKRADIEVARAANAHEKRAAAARATNQKRWDRGSLEEPIAKRLAERIADRPESDGEPEPEPEPTTSPTVKPAPKGARASGLELLLEAGVSKQVAEDWAAIRKGKRLKLFTKTEVAELIRQAAVAKLTPHQAVEAAVQRGWGGFRSAWLERESLDRFGKPAPVSAPSGDRAAETKAYLKSLEQTPEERAASAEARKLAMAAFKVMK